MSSSDYDMPNPHLLLMVVLLCGFVLLRLFPASTTSAKLFRLSIVLSPLAYLIQVTDQVAVPFSGGTLMTCALVGMCSIKLIHQMLSQTGGEKPSAFDYASGFLWFALPIQKVPDNKRLKLIERIQFALICFIWMLIKIAVVRFVELWLLQCLGNEALPLPYFTSVMYSSIFYLWVVCGNYQPDFLVALLPLLTGGRYEILTFNNYPFLSTSPRQFWSKRYNLVVRALLRDAVFLPARSNGFSPEAASFFAFLVSGVLHLYVAQVTFLRGAVSALVFFLLHWILCLLPVPKKDTFSVPHILFTFGLIALTTPLYLGLFLSEGTLFLKSNPTGLDFLIPSIPFEPICPVRF